MSAAEALKAARAAGIGSGSTATTWCWRRRAPPPAAVLDLLSRHKAGHRGAAAAGQRRLVGRGLAGLLRRAGRHRRVRWRSAARRGRGPRLRLLRRRMAEPQLRALAARPLPRLRWRRSCARPAAAASASSRPAMPGCIRAAGPPGTPAGRPRPSPPWRRWGSRRRPSFQTISEEAGRWGGWQSDAVTGEGGCFTSAPRTSRSALSIPFVPRRAIPRDDIREIKMTRP